MVPIFSVEQLLAAFVPRKLARSEILKRHVLAGGVGIVFKSGPDEALFVKVPAYPLLLRTKPGDVVKTHSGQFIRPQSNMSRSDLSWCHAIYENLPCWCWGVFTLPCRRGAYGVSDRKPCPGQDLVVWWCTRGLDVEMSRPSGRRPFGIIESRPLNALNTDPTILPPSTRPCLLF